MPKDWHLYLPWVLMALILIGPRFGKSLRWVRKQMQPRPIMIEPTMPQDDPATAEKITAAVLAALRPTLDTNQTESDTMKRLLEESQNHRKVLLDIADYSFTQNRLLKKLIKAILGGTNYEEFTDERALELEQVEDLMDRKGMTREQAVDHVRAQKTYTRDNLGLRRG